MTDKNTLDLARQWAEDVDACPWMLSPNTTAAADLISSLPDEIKQVIKDSIEDYKAGRFVDFDLSESASPRPEDVPAGEAWQVEVNGKVAIGYRNDPEDRLPWSVTYRDNAGAGYMDDAGVTLIARLVPETTKQDDDQEFDPTHAYRDGYGVKWARVAGAWRREGRLFFHPYSAPPVEYGPYTRIEKENNHDQ